MIMRCFRTLILVFLLMGLCSINLAQESDKKITLDDLTAADTLIGDLEAARAEYLREKGESQDATKEKDAAFAKMDDWMSEFYAVAKIALEDKPQLLESLGKFVRS